MIRHIWAVGRNYADHAKELGNSIPQSPLIFLKAGSCAVEDSNLIQLPTWTEDVHHEIELALRFDSNLQIDAMALALDLTERKRQNQLKSQGQPWTLAKSFVNSCPLSQFIPASAATNWAEYSLELSVNEELRQQGSLSQMIFTIPTLVQYVCEHFPVVPGDILLTGTPAGVASLKNNDLLDARLCMGANTLITKKWQCLR